MTTWKFDRHFLLCFLYLRLPIRTRNEDVRPWLFGPEVFKNKRFADFIFNSFSVAKCATQTKMCKMSKFYRLQNNMRKHIICLGHDRTFIDPGVIYTPFSKMFLNKNLDPERELLLNTSGLNNYGLTPSLQVVVGIAR